MLSKRRKNRLRYKRLLVTNAELHKKVARLEEENESLNKEIFKFKLRVGEVDKPAPRRMIMKVKSKHTYGGPPR